MVGLESERAGHRAGRRPAGVRPRATAGCRGSRSSSAGCTASAARPTTAPRACSAATPGRRRTGARCTSPAASSAAYRREIEAAADPRCQAGRDRGAASRRWRRRSAPPRPRARTSSTARHPAVAGRLRRRRPAASSPASSARRRRCRTCRSRPRRRQCWTTVPPSTFQDWPVTQAPWSEHRYTTVPAMSSPVPARPSGTLALDRLVPRFAPAEVVHAGRVDDAGADRVDPDAVRRRPPGAMHAVSAWMPAFDAA